MMTTAKMDVGDDDDDDDATGGDEESQDCAVIPMVTIVTRVCVVPTLIVIMYMFKRPSQIVAYCKMTRAKADKFQKSRQINCSLHVCRLLS